MPTCVSLPSPDKATPLVRMPDTAGHESPLARCRIRCESIDDHRAGAAGEVECRASVPVRAAITAPRVGDTDIEEEVPEIAGGVICRLTWVDGAAEAHRSEIADLENPYRFGRREQPR